MPLVTDMHTQSYGKIVSTIENSHSVWGRIFNRSPGTFEYRLLAGVTNARVTTAAHVSERFARVFADEHGEIHACVSCSANAGIAEAAKERARGT